MIWTTSRGASARMGWNAQVVTCLGAFFAPLFVTVMVTGCGGSHPESVALPPVSSSTVPSARSRSSVDDDDLSTAGRAAAASASAMPIVVGPDGSLLLENLLNKTSKDFPVATEKDASCMKGLELSGKHDKDYSTLAERCGVKSGMREFAKKAVGKLDPKHPRDIYTFKMLGGFCYRFFAVADDSIANLTIRVQRPDGELLSVVGSKQPVAILDPDRAWCKTHDREFRLVVETSSGQGSYTFGVWARPKP